jgi:hypothetical protein
MNEKQERLQEIRKDAIELIQMSVKNQVEQLDELLKTHGEAIYAEDKGYKGPMATPKNIVVAMMIREAWQWGPPGCRIQISTSNSALPSSKWARGVINRIRGWLQ